MIKLALKNPIAIIMLSLALLLFAGVSTPKMTVDTFPELTPPVLVIGTLASGMGAKDIEKTITWRIEKYVSATPGVDHVQSTSRNNLSVVYVWLKWGTDLNATQGLVQQQVQFAMAAVPKSLGVLPPFVLQYDPTNAPVVQVAIYGGGMTGPQLYDYAVNNIEPGLEGIPGVASASVNGGRQRQINIIVDPASAQARGVTSTEVGAAVRETNAVLPSGVFLTKDFTANVYTNSVASSIKQIEEAVIKQVDGHPILVRDVARVEDGGSPATQAVSIDGKNGVYLNVLRVPGGNTIKIVDAVKENLAGLKNLPPGLQVKPIFDQSTFVRTTYSGLQREIVQALILIGLVILFFLQSPRAVLISVVAIPISFAIILLVLNLSGQTLNAFTLGGLTLAMGPLVDISVVVIEAVHRELDMGKSPFRAALDGASSVAVPTFAATLTTTAVLLPIVLLAGLAKKLFVPLGITVATGMFAGYFVSMTLTPVLCRYLFKGHAEPNRLARTLQGWVAEIANFYARALSALLPYRFGFLAVTGLMVAASGWAASHLPSTFFPEIDESMERVYVRLPAGMSLAESSARIAAMGKELKDALPKGEVELALANVGAPGNARSAMNSPNDGPHMGFIRLALADAEHRKHSQREIADLSRKILKERFPGVDFLQWPGGLVASVFANGFNAPLVVEVAGDKMDDLYADAGHVADVARTIPGVRDVWITLATDYPEVRLNTDRQEAGLVGVTSRAAAQATLEATLGNINSPSVWVDPRNGNSYYVVTAYDGDVVNDPASLATIPAKLSASGKAVTLGAYGNLERSTGAVSIERNQLHRATHVFMQTEGRDVGSAAAELEQRLHEDAATKGIEWHYVGQVELMRTTFAGVGGAIVIAITIVFMIMASQFKSVRLPFVMLFTIPVSLIGIVLALMAAGQGFSITALMGMLMVVGIAVSNGILLVDEAQRRFIAGADKKTAMVEAARVRFVPIVMTSLATVIGLLPTALGLEAGTESNQPLALAVCGGLTTSTILSLFLVPSVFLSLAKRPAPTDEEQEASAAAAAPVASAG
jgi:multidrug efflux pump subunit AcrB